MKESYRTKITTKTTAQAANVLLSRVDNEIRTTDYGHKIPCLILMDHTEACLEALELPLNGRKIWENKMLKLRNVRLVKTHDERDKVPLYIYEVVSKI